MKTKICTKCRIEKPLSDFYKDNRHLDNHRRDCKVCRAIYEKNHRNKNLELFKIKDASYYKKYKKEIKIKQKKYRQINKEKLLRISKDYYQSHKKQRLNYYLKNKKKINNQKNINDKKRKKIDINFRIRCNLGTRLSIAIQNNQKAGHTLKLLGCSVEFLKKYLESQFKEGMTWDNYGIGGWEIDHIIPCVSFDLRQSTEQYKCFNYTNLQPLWAEENRGKTKIRRKNVI